MVGMGSEFRDYPLCGMAMNKLKKDNLFSDFAQAVMDWLPEITERNF